MTTIAISTYLPAGDPRSHRGGIDSRSDRAVGGFDCRRWIGSPGLRVAQGGRSAGWLGIGVLVALVAVGLYPSSTGNPAARPEGSTACR